MKLSIAFSQLAYAWCIVPLLFSSTTALAGSPPTLSSPKALQIEKANPKISVSKSAMELKADAEITNIGFRTENDGAWTFTYDITNTGFRTWKPREVQYRASQYTTDNNRENVHTVNTDHTVPAGGTISGAYQFNRCSKTNRLNLEVLLNGQSLTSKIATVPPIDVKINRITPAKNNTSLTVSLKNNTPYATNVTVKAVSPKTPLEKRAIGGFRVSQKALVPANGTKDVTIAVADAKKVTQVVALFVDENQCAGPGYVVLDSKSNSPFGQAGTGSTVNGPVAIVEDISWSRPSKTWVATIKNRDPDNSVNVGYAGYPMENGVQGMTVWGSSTIPANDTVQLVGDYSAYSVPPGTRLKVHVLLKPGNNKIHEKIIVLE